VKETFMRSSLALVLVLGVSAFAPLAVAHAQSRDVSSLGGDAYVRFGEIVDDVSAFGGSAHVDGEVLGNVSAFGGDVLLGPTAIVHGSVDAAGGRVEMKPGAQVAGGLGLVAPLQPPTVDRGRDEHHAGGEPAALVRGLVFSALLFLFALLLTGVVPERMSAMHVAIIREPGRSAGAGLLGYVSAAIVLVALMITIIGIPLALALAVLVPVATFVGLAAAATVIGAALPVERLRGRPVLQILAGVGVLFVVDQIPVLGAVAIAIVACIGLGALLRTRFRPTPPAELESGRSEGPYRESASV
jgi:hypothetical protein